VADPLIRAFFIGRAAADLLFEKLEDSLTDVLSEVGKFESEQREKLRTFTDEVLDRAAQQEAKAEEDLAAAVQEAQTTTDRSQSRSSALKESDLQATVDGLRAEIAQLRAQLQRYRANT